MDHDVGLQQAILASLKSGPPPPRPSGGGGGSSSSYRLQPTTSYSRSTTTTTNHQPNYRRPAAGGIGSSSPSSFSFGSPSPSTSSNVLPNGRRNTLQRQGIVPTTTGSSSASTANRTRTPRTRSNPVSSKSPGLSRRSGGPQDNNKKGGGGMNGKEQESYAMMMEEDTYGGSSTNNNNVGVPPTSSTSEIASAYSHLGAAFASASSGGGERLSAPPPRPNASQQNPSQQQNTSTTNNIKTVGDISTTNPLPSNTWKELSACLQASGKIQRQNPSGSHLVFDSANSDSLQSLERISSSSKLYPGDFVGMITSDTITKVTDGVVSAQANGAMFQCAIKPMTKLCSVFLGVLPSSESPMTIIELNFSNSTGSCSASEFSFSDDSSSLSRLKQVERPSPLRAAESSTGARYARAKNQQTDWNLMPVTLTLTRGSLQLDVSGENVIKNVAVQSLDSVPQSKIFFGVSGRCTVKNVLLGDVAEIRKQQLVQNVNAASNPMVSVIENEILDRNPNVQWSDVAALEEAKRVLNEAIVLPMLIPEFFATIEPPKGVLLFGPPGTGKTMLARAIATCTKTTFFNISAASIMGKFVGESEKMVRTLFQVARRDAPSTIFFDEIDSVMTKRGGASEHEASRRVKTELLQNIDGIVSNNSGDPAQNVIVLATVNAPWLLDEAIIRRLEKRIYIPLPNATARLELFKISLRKSKTNFNVDELLSSESNESIKTQISEVVKKLDAAEEQRQQKLFDRMRKGGESSNNNNEEKEINFYSFTTSDDFQPISTTSKNTAKILQLVEATHGYSGADLAVVMKDASMYPLRRLIGGKSPQEIFEMKQRGELMGPDGQPPPMLLDDVFEALKKVRPSVNQADLFKFVEWGREYGST